MNDLLTIRIADICIGIKPLNEGFNSFCKDYVTDEDPVFVLGATHIDLEDERERVAEYEDQINVSDYSELELEKLWIYRQIAETIPKYNSFLIHATSVRVDEDAYLFLGPSGAGKTTHARLWEQYFGDRFTVINDDKPIIRVTDEEILVCGSPWSGKERWCNNIDAPLRGAVNLNQATENRVEKLSQGDAWRVMMNQVYRSSDAETMKRTMRLLDEVINRRAIYEMECAEDPGAARIAYRAISESGPERCQNSI